MAESRESIFGEYIPLEIFRGKSYVFVRMRIELFDLNRQSSTISLKCFKEMTLDALSWVWYNKVRSLFDMKIGEGDET